tara:strand:+ start:3282 stop:5123 length:1842 start_codon:yes stop_codon:yes gene_type:complete
MAIQYLHDINLNDNELQNAKVHVTDTTPTAAAGQIYLHETSGTLRFHTGSGWVTVSTDTSDDNKFITGLSFNTTSGVLTATFNDSSTTTVDLDGKYADASHTHAAGDITSGTFADGRIPSLNASKISAGTFADGRIPNLGASKITSGTFADARIASSNVTQHVGDIVHDSLSGFVANEHIDWTADYSATDQIDAANIPNLGAGKITSGTLGTARIPDLAASKITSGTLGDARIPSLAASKITSGTFDAARIPNLNASKINAGTIAVAQGGTGAATLDGAGIVTKSGTQTLSGAKTFSGNVTINGDLTVSGNQTTKNSEVVLIEDNIITLNSNETGSPSEDSGILVERGTGTNVQWIWDESASRWGAFGGESMDTKGNVGVGTLYADTIDATNYGLIASDIPNLAASKITSGTLGTARIPNLAASKINSGTLDAARIPTLAFGTKTSGTVGVDRGGTNATAFADKSVIVSQDSGTDTLQAKAMTASGSLLIGGASGPEVATLTEGSNITITNADGAITIASSVSTSDINTQIDARSSAHTITGDGNDVEFTITYGFTAAATNDVMVQVVDSSGDHDGDTVFAEVERDSTTQCKIKFASAPANNKTYRVLCFKIA